MTRGEQPPPAWVIIPALDLEEMTALAVEDALAQSIQPNVLLVNQGSATPIRQRWERWAEQEPRLYVWTHMPPLPGLSATWNRALQFVWAVGGQEALVVNNDVRLHRETYEQLRGVMGHTHGAFITAVGVRPEEFDPTAVPHIPLTPPDDEGWGHPMSPGGPDFSCFLISKECHDAFPFDEGFIPCYNEDIDYHRRMMLAGKGEEIFSVNLPFAHVRSATINRTPEIRAAFHKKYEQSLRHFQAKWGGRPNEERWTIPFDAGSDQDGVTTPELQHGTRLRDETSA